MSPGGQEEEGTQTAVLWTAWEQAPVQPAVPGSPAPGRFSCAIWAGMPREQCHATLVTVSRLPGGCDSSPAPEQSAQGSTVYEEQGLCSSQEVAHRFKTSQMYLLITKLIWAC